MSEGSEVATTEAITGLVVPTTHWDRDWYWPFERFRVKLIEMFEAVRELWAADPDYVFTIDGQSIAIEDYLEVLPERAAELRAMGEAGRFFAGPLYVLSDVWLTGAEAFIRNLLIGRADAARFAASQDTVYQPDTFGFHPELPSLIAGCGLDTFAAMRGAPVEAIGDQRFFHWEGPDGTGVQVCRLRDGYANAARLGRTAGTGEIMDAKSKASGIHPGFSLPMAIDKLRAACDKLRDGHGAPHLLLAGVDHQIPQRELPDILAATADEHTAFRYAGLDAVAAAMRAHPRRDRWHVYRGELHDDSAHKLGGTISSRIHLKQANAAAERLLARSIEPAAVALQALGIAEPASAVIRHAWRTLLKVHPHDDITGCSVDAVHRENEIHLARALQAGDALERRFVAHLVRHYGAQDPEDERHGFVCYATEPTTGPQRVRVTVDCEGRYRFGDIVLPEHLRVVDEDGAAVPFRLLRRGPCAEHPHPQLELELSVELPPFQLRRFFLEAGTPAASAGPMLANEHLRVAVAADGSATVEDLATGTRWRDCGRFDGQADVGDTYTFSPQPGASEERLRPQLSAEGLSLGGGMQAVRLRGHLAIPAHSRADGRRAEPVDLPVAITWSLAPGERAVQVDIELDNRAEDHRLRWGCSLPQRPAAVRVGHKLADQRRAVRRARQRGDGTWALPIHPADHHLTVDQDAASLSLFSAHPFEYEVAEDGETARCALTLLRAVGMLSVRERVATRTPGAGPDTPTPEAQCRRAYAWCFALRPGRADEDALPAAMSWRARPLRGVLWGADPDHRHADRSLLELEQPADGPLRLHACKPAEDGEGWILRLANPGARAAAGRLVGPLVAAGLQPCDHLERPLAEPRLDPDAADGVTLEVAGWGLRSFRCS